MFTGLIESVGHVEDATPAESGVRLRVRTALAAEIRAGDSLAVNGVCLTVVATGNPDLRLLRGHFSASAICVARTTNFPTMSHSRLTQAKPNAGGERHDPPGDRNREPAGL